LTSWKRHNHAVTSSRSAAIFEKRPSGAMPCARWTGRERTLDADAHARPFDQAEGSGTVRRMAVQSSPDLRERLLLLRVRRSARARARTEHRYGSSPWP
jgi:hypothetical protein